MASTTTNSEGEDPLQNMAEKGHNSSRTSPSPQLPPSDAEQAMKPESTAELQQQNPDPAGIGPLRLVMIMLGLSFAILCTGLDRSILSTIIPTIVTDFNSLNDVGWYGSAYMLTLCSFQLVFGKMFAEFNAKWVFLASLALFEVGSVICAAAPNSIALIVGRAVAGIGASGLFSGAMIIVGESVPTNKRPAYLGMIGSVSGIAMAIAPTLGGALTDHLTWRWCFWINLFLGVGTLVAILVFYRPRPRPQSTTKPSIIELANRIDAIGGIMVIGTTTSLLLALQWGGTTYSWGNWRVVLCLVIFGVVGIAWVYYQHRTGDRGLLPLRLLKNRSVLGSNFYSSTTFPNFTIFLYWVPTWFQAVKNVSAQQSGVYFLAAALTYTVFLMMTGGLITKIGYYVPFLFLSSTLVSVGMGLTYTFNEHTSTGFWVGALILVGAGTGFGGQIPIVTAQTVLKKQDAAIGTGVAMFVQTLSGTIFLSVANNVFDQRLVRELKSRVPDVDPATVLAQGANHFQKAMAAKYPGQVHEIVTAYNAALQNVFLLGLVLACLSVLGGTVMEWIDVRAKRSEEAVATEVSKKEG